MAYTPLFVIPVLAVLLSCELHFASIADHWQELRWKSAYAQSSVAGIYFSLEERKLSEALWVCPSNEICTSNRSRRLNANSHDSLKPGISNMPGFNHRRFCSDAMSRFPLKFRMLSIHDSGSGSNGFGC